MSEETPAAPAPEAAPAETSTPTTPATEAAPATPAEQAAQPEATTPATEATPNKPYFSDEQLAEMQKFIENNGGYDSAWKKMKAGISAPQKAPEQPVAPQTQSEPVKTPEAPQTAPQEARPGTYSLEELAAQSYFERLAGEEKYANIADEIRSGAVLKGLKDFNITPVADGRVNDADIRKYLDLYSASRPAKPTSAEPTVSPSMSDTLSDITEVTTREQADRIQIESLRRRAAGQPEHPLEAKAKEFIKNYYSKPKGKR